MPLGLAFPFALSKGFAFQTTHASAWVGLLRSFTLRYAIRNVSNSKCIQQAQRSTISATKRFNKGVRSDSVAVGETVLGGILE